MSIGRAIRRIVAHRRSAVGHHGPLWRRRHRVPVAAAASMAMLRSMGWRSSVLSEVPPAVGALRRALGEGIRFVGRKGVLCVGVGVVAMEAIRHELASG